MEISNLSTIYTAGRSAFKTMSCVGDKNLEGKFISIKHIRERWGEKNGLRAERTIIGKFTGFDFGLEFLLSDTNVYV